MLNFTPSKEIHLRDYQADATEALRQGIRAARVRPASRVQWRWPAGRDKADAAGFSRQLATLLRAGVPLLQAFEVMGRSGGDEHLGRLLTQFAQLRADALG